MEQFSNFILEMTLKGFHSILKIIVHKHMTYSLVFIPHHHISNKKILPFENECVTNTYGGTSIFVNNLSVIMKYFSTHFKQNLKDLLI